MVNEQMRINIQFRPKRIWHSDCQVSRYGGIMDIVRHEPEKSLLKCLHCGKQGFYPVGGSGERCVDVVSNGVSTDE